MMFKRKDPAQLAQQLQQMTGGQGQQADASEWKITLDNAGNGSAVIRFLPGRTDDSAPFVKLINHGFKGPNNKWYIENCSSTHNDWDNCPVCAYIKENDLFNTNNAAYQQYKRKTSYWANILIVKDPSAPENEGKIFKYRFGQKVMDKINGMIQVDTAMGDIPVDVTCPFEGANFSLKVKRVSGHSNYDESRFQNQTQIPKIDDEAVQKKFAEEMHDIDKLVASDQFKSLDELTKDFNKIIGTAALGSAASQAADQADKLADELDNFSKEMNNHKEQKTVKSTSDSDSLDDLMKDL